MSTPFLYFISILGTGLGFVQQILVSGFWSNAFSRDVHHFSTNLAFYFLSLGMGSALSSRRKVLAIQDLLCLVFAQAAWSGLSIIFLREFAAHGWTSELLPIVVVSISGLMAGPVIPWASKLGENVAGFQISKLFFFDYAAAMTLSLLFTVFLLPRLGYVPCALLATFSATLALLMGVALSRTSVTVPLALSIFVNLVPYPIHRGAKYLSKHRTAPQGLELVFQKQTQYQKVTLAKFELPKGLFGGEGMTYALYLDGFLQFSSAAEALYHACLVNIPMAAASFQGNPVKNALILGGGDGLAARNLLANSSVQSVTLVEIDPVVLQLAMTHPQLKKFNLGALKSPRIHLIADDAFSWIRSDSKQYDLILIDFPAPKNLQLARLFSAEFYRAVLDRLSPQGIAIAQAGPTFEMPGGNGTLYSKIPTTIKRTFQSLGKDAHILFTPEDSDAFVMVSNNPSFAMDTFAKKIGIDPEGALSYLCAHDASIQEPKTQINTLNNLAIAEYSWDWYQRVGFPYYHYEGAMGAFLPE